MSQSLRILLIADDPEVIRRIGHGLQRQDSGLILIEGAESLATARRRLNSGSYDVALVDLALGQGDGLHLLSELGEIAPDLAVVALAADGTGPDAAACLALGAQDRLAPEAMDSNGLLDRLRSATDRARAGQNSRRRSQRIAASLGAAGDLAWHYESGEEQAWLAAADPGAWALPSPECSESLEALRSRLHPDDRELAVRRIEELVSEASPWQLEARFKVGGGAYRWCVLRGRAELGPQGQLLRVSGVISDAQRQQKKVREQEQARRFLRAVFDSQRVPKAVLDSSAVITDCNRAWLALDDPAIHAGAAFGPGRKFTDPPGSPGLYGDLDAAALARGVKQVLGGVSDHYECEYGDGERCWRVTVSPLLNPGIAGAVISHEEITAARRADLDARGHLATLEADFRAIDCALYRVGSDFEVRTTNAAGEALGRAPVLGRDILKVLPRQHAEAVSDGLVAMSAGVRSVVRDTAPRDGEATRWLLALRRDDDGHDDGFLLLGVDVSDLLRAGEPSQEAGRQRELEELRTVLRETETERERLGKLLAEADARAAELRTELAQAGTQLEAARREAEETRASAETARRDAAGISAEAEAASRALQAADRALEAERSKQEQLASARQQLEEALEAERRRRAEALEALSEAGEVPARMRAELDQARAGLRHELDALLERVFMPLLEDPRRSPATGDRGKDEAR